MDEEPDKLKEIKDLYNFRGVFYIPALSIALNSLQAGIMLSQLLFWHGKGHKDDFWTYKNTRQFYCETGLRRSGQETAIKHLVEAGVLEVKLAGIPATRNFRLDIDAVQSLISRWLESGNLDKHIFSKPIAQSKQSITDTTNKTAQINSESDLDFSVVGQFTSSEISIKPPD